MLGAKKHSITLNLINCDKVDRAGLVAIES